MASRNRKGQFVKRKKGTSIARTRAAPVRRRSAAAPARRRRSSGGGGGGWLPRGDELKDIAAAGVYGWLESGFVRKEGIGFQVLNAIPTPVDAVGFTGNVALIAWVGAKLTKNKWLRHFARGAASVAIYKLGRRGSAYTSATDISGDEDDDVAGEADGWLDPGAMVPG